MSLPLEGKVGNLPTEANWSDEVKNTSNCYILNIETLCASLS